MAGRVNESDLTLFYKCVLALETEDECKAFFSDLCTIMELYAMAQRINIAEMLTNKVIYEKIVKNTGASTATISRVNRSLKYGENGYMKMLNRVKAEEE